MVNSQQYGALKKRIWGQTTSECPERCGIGKQRRPGAWPQSKKEGGMNGLMETNAAKQESRSLGGCIELLVLSPLFGKMVGSLAQPCLDRI